MLMVLALNLLIFLPVAAGVAVWGLPARRADWAPRVALAVGMVCLVLALGLCSGLPAVTRGGAGVGALIGETDAGWIVLGEHGTGGAATSGVELRYHVGLDAISLPLVVLTALLVPLSVACSFSAIRTRTREYYAWLLLLTAAMFGVFAARDVLLFYIFFEFTLVPLYFLIGVWGGPQRRFAASKFFLYTFAGSVLTFAGLVYLAIRSAELRGDGVVSFDLGVLSAWSGLSPIEQSWLFLALLCGFAIKVPLFPVHTWLPLAHTEAPTAGSVLLAGVLLKLGTYGFLRFSLPLVPAGAVRWAAVMGVLAVAGIIWGALASWVQRDVKKLVAYSSVSHLGFCMLGMFSLVPVGLSGSVLYMVNHGLSTGALFLVVGMVYERYHTRDLEQIGGLARQMPRLAFFFVLFVLSSVGLPGLNGFVSEFTVLLAAFNSDVLGRWYGAIGATGILLGAVYMLYAAGKVLFGPIKEPPGTPDLSAGLKRDLTGREVAILVPLAAAVVLLGVAPRIVTDPLDVALQAQILSRVEGQQEIAGRNAVGPFLPPGRSSENPRGLSSLAISKGAPNAGPRDGLGRASAGLAGAIEARLKPAEPVGKEERWSVVRPPPPEGGGKTGRLKPGQGQPAPSCSAAGGARERAADGARGSARGWYSIVSPIALPSARHGESAGGGDRGMEASPGVGVSP